MNTTSGFTPEEQARSWYLERLRHDEIFKIGQRDILEKLLVISRPWIQGKDTNEAFAIKLNEFFDRYAKKEN